MLSIRTRTSTPIVASNGTAQASSIDQTSLYLTKKLVIPTVKVSTSTANCDPKHIPSIASDPAHNTGGTGIKPHLCSIPTFTEQDVRQYMSTIHSFNGMRISQTSPKYIITRILFITNQVANAANGLNADTGVGDPGLIVMPKSTAIFVSMEALICRRLKPLLPRNQFSTDGQWYSMASPEMYLTWASSRKLQTYGYEHLHHSDRRSRP